MTALGSKSSINLDAHRQLLCECIEEFLGPLARKLMERLLNVGHATLKELADFVRYKDVFCGATTRAPFNDLHTEVTSSTGAGSLRSSLGSATTAIIRQATDKDIKQVMVLLLQHDIITYDDNDKTYATLLGKGIIVFLQPTFIRFIRKEHGEAGDIVLTILMKYGKLSLTSLEKEVIRTHPTMLAAVDRATADMRHRGYIVCDSDDGVNDAELKRSRTENGGSFGMGSSTNSGLPFVPNYAQMVYDMRNEKVISLLHDRFGVVGGKVAEAIINCRNNKSGGKQQANMVPIRRSHINHTVNPTSNVAPLPGYPQMSDLSPHIPFQEILSAIHQASPNTATGESTIRSKIAEMCCDDFGGVIQQNPTASGDLQYCVNFSRCALLLKMDIVYKVMFARYGVVGVRMAKILLEKQAMEDRFLAEETICSLAQVREGLLAMMKDGYARQIEVPKMKLDVNAERNPKNSNFLWTMSTKEHVIGVVRRHLVLSIRGCRTRLAYELKVLTEKFPDRPLESLTMGPHHRAVPHRADATEEAPDITNTPSTLTPSDEGVMIRGRFAARALQVNTLAQMELMVVLELF